MPPPPSRRALLSALASAPWVALAQGLPAAQTPEDPSDEALSLAGNCVLAGFHGPRLPGVFRELLSRDALAGVLVSGDNRLDRLGLEALSRQVQALCPADAPALIAADQEGGAVSHLTPPLPSLPSLTALGRVDDPELTRRVGAMLGHTLREVGVTLDLAPVVDVRTSTDNMVLLGRTFGGDPTRAARHAPAMVAGLLAAGVLACAKHFPGHGDTREDSHEVLPRVPHDRARLDAVELVPFRSVLPVVPAVMLAHVIYEGVDRQRPASLSPLHARELLREHLGFQGVAVSDDLEMAPIRTGLGVPAAAVQAVAAGCDLVLTAHSAHNAVDAVRALALRADRDGAFRERLREARGRVRTMRATLNRRVPPNPYRETPEALQREVLQRVRGLREPRYRDPTR